jgi:hypothetical protein
MYAPIAVAVDDNREGTSVRRICPAMRFVHRVCYSLVR